jgi:hypothetical protein
MSSAFQRWVRSTITFDQGKGMCFRKGSYRTKEIAEAYKAKSEARQPGLTLYIYKCPVCRKYHLTKQKQNKECE